MLVALLSSSLEITKQTFKRLPNTDKNQINPAKNELALVNKKDLKKIVNAANTITVSHW